MFIRLLLSAVLTLNFIELTFYFTTYTDPSRLKTYGSKILLLFLLKKSTKVMGNSQSTKFEGDLIHFKGQDYQKLKAR